MDSILSQTAACDGIRYTTTAERQEIAPGILLFNKTKLFILLVQSYPSFITVSLLDFYVLVCEHFVVLICNKFASINVNLEQRRERSE